MPYRRNDSSEHYDDYDGGMRCVIRNPRYVLVLLVVCAVCLLFADGAHATLVPTLKQPPNVIVQACPSDAGTSCTGYGGPIYLHPDDVRRPRVLQHELGHHFDYALPADSGVHERFASIMRDTREWRSPPNSPHEQFAELYAICARTTPRNAHAVQAGYMLDITRKQVRAGCGLICRAGRRYTDRYVPPTDAQWCAVKR